MDFPCRSSLTATWSTRSHCATRIVRLSWGYLQGMHEEDEDYQVRISFKINLSFLKEVLFWIFLEILFPCRKVMSADGQSTRVEDKVLTINVKPGWKSGTKITFPKEGDQHPGRVPADIVFVIKVRLIYCNLCSVQSYCISLNNIQFGIYLFFSG